MRKKHSYLTRCGADGRWKFGVCSALRPGYMTWSLRSYSSDAGAARAARAYLGSYQAIHDKVKCDEPLLGLLKKTMDLKGGDDGE